MQKTALIQKFKRQLPQLMAMFMTLATLAAPAFAADPVILGPDLRGTGWEGTYTVAGIANPIRTGFLNEVDAKGEIPYFHKIINAGVTSEMLGTVDVACDYTPRGVRMDSPTTGVISIYGCENTLAGEESLESDPNRAALASVKISKVTLSPDGGTMTFVATFSASAVGKEISYDVAYELHRQTLPPEALTSRQALRAWVVR